MNTRRIVFKVNKTNRKQISRTSPNRVSPLLSSFTSKKSLIHSPNGKILRLLKFDMKTNKYFKNPEEIVAQGKLNSFFAFRTYYSQFGGQINQNHISSILAKEWKSDIQEQQLWSTMTEQYKQIKDI